MDPSFIIADDSQSSGATQSTATIVIDSSHHYFLHPSDSPGMNLVTSVFDGKGFGG